MFKTKNIILIVGYVITGSHNKSKRKLITNDRSCVKVDREWRLSKAGMI